MATMFYDQLKEKEFLYPEHLSQKTVDLAFLIRQVVNLPMVVLQDACPPDSTSHARHSLHKWGIDHARSIEENRLVPDDTAEGQAIDFYFISPGLKPDVLITQFLQILPLTKWGGIGVYPDWRPYPGFHIDTRSPRHRYWRTCWIGYKNDNGRQQYLYRPTFRDLERMNQRGFRPNGSEW